MRRPKVRIKFRSKSLSIIWSIVFDFKSYESMLKILNHLSSILTVRKRQKEIQVELCYSVGFLTLTLPSSQIPRILAQVTLNLSKTKMCHSPRLYCYYWLLETYRAYYSCTQLWLSVILLRYFMYYICRINYSEFS